MEEFLEDGRNTLLDRFMVGGVLFAVHSRARLGDLKEVRAFKLDFSSYSSDEGFIECISLSHKSRRYTQATGLCFYLVAPIKGVGGACWGRTWSRVAQQLGIELCSMPDGAAVLQSPLSSGVLSGRAICATKLMAWLRAVLKGSGLSPEHFTGHSAKTTTLSWMAKANISEATRCVLGHHTPKVTTAVITYARDEQSGPLRELAIVYRDIRNGRFRPDASRSRMFMSTAELQRRVDCVPDLSAPETRVWPPAPEAMTSEIQPHPSRALDVPNEDEREWYARPQLDEGAGALSEAEVDALIDEARSQAEGSLALEQEVASNTSESSSSSDSSSSSGSDEELDDSLHECSGGADVHRTIGQCEIHQHRRTKTLHLMPEGSSSGKFVCGRALTSDYKPLVSSVVLDKWYCKQCKVGRPIRDTGSLSTALEHAVSV